MGLHGTGFFAGPPPESPASLQMQQMQQDLMGLVPGGVTYVAEGDFERMRVAGILREPAPKADPVDTRPDVEKRFAGLIWDDEGKK